MLLLFRRGTRELQVIRPLLASAGLTFLSASDIRNGDGELTQVSNVRKEGLYVQTVAPVTGVVTGETGPTTNTVRISTNLVKPNNSAVALSDFDNGFAFGNDTLFETVRAIVEQ